MSATLTRDAGGSSTGRSSASRHGALFRSVGVLVSLGLLLLAVRLSLGVGSVTLAPSTVVEAFIAFAGSNEHLIVRSLRLPRTSIGVAVGAALAVAGVAMQAITRDALASPTILGVNAGASFATATRSQRARLDEPPIHAAQPGVPRR